MKTKSNLQITGNLLYIEQLTPLVWHIRLAAALLKPFDPDRVPGYWLSLRIGGYFRRYPIWNYDPLRQIVDLAVPTSHDWIVTEWLENLGLGDEIVYLEAEETTTREISADAYYLIGDVDALSFFYQLNRNLPFNKIVKSLIYSTSENLLFPDLDKSYPFDFHLLGTSMPETVLKKFQALFSSPTNDCAELLCGNVDVNEDLVQFIERGWQSKENPVKLATFDIANHKIVFK